MTRLLLIAGVASPVVYSVADVVAGNLYQGYSFRGQAAVSCSRSARRRAGSWSRRSPRGYSLITIAVLVVAAAFAFTYAPRMIAHQPTPWLGLTERISQYAHQAWMAVFALSTNRSEDAGKIVQS